MIPSRFSTRESVEFEFNRSAEMSINYQNVYVSGVEINFATAPTSTDTMQLFFSDDEGEDLIWEGNAQSKTHLSYAPKLHIPVPNKSKLILRYENPNDVEVTARFLWRV